MKFHVPYLKLGETVRARVVDVLPGQELVINLSGDLIRVANESRHDIQPGEAIDLIVTALQPLQFRMAVHSSASTLGPKNSKIDVSV